MYNTECQLERYIHARYDEAYLHNLIPQEHDKKILKWIKRPRGFVVMMGSKGTGKTHRCVALCRELKKMTGKPAPLHGVFYYDQPRFYDEYKALIQNKWSEYSLNERNAEAKALCIDDFGMTANTEWQVQIMSDIINRRYNNKRPTIISTNLSFNEIEDKFHPRVRDRLEASENLILAFEGESLRERGY